MGQRLARQLRPATPVYVVECQPSPHAPRAPVFHRQTAGPVPDYARSAVGLGVDRIRRAPPSVRCATDDSNDGESGFLRGQLGISALFPCLRPPSVLRWYTLQASEISTSVPHLVSATRPTPSWGLVVGRVLSNCEIMLDTVPSFVYTVARSLMAYASHEGAVGAAGGKNSIPTGQHVRIVLSLPTNVG